MGVTSGSFNTSAYDSRKLQFSWSIKSQDKATNKTVISWTLTAVGKGNYNEYKAGNFLVKIDGVEVYYSSTRITTRDGTSITSGEYTLYHNTDGTRSFSAYAEAGIYTYAVNCSGSGSWELKDIQRAASITSAPNITDDDTTITIGITNPAGAAVQSIRVCIANSNGNKELLTYRSIPSINDTTYTFTVTDAERKALRQYVTSGNTATVRFYIRTYYSADEYAFGESVARTLTLLDYKPKLNPVLNDVSIPAQQLVGNPQKFIKGTNIIEYTIGAEGQKEATIVSQSIVCGSKKGTSATGELVNVENNTFTISATDSRGNTTTQDYTLEMIDYIYLSCSQDVGIELTGETAVANVEVSGNYYNGSFGAANNALYLRYRYKVEGAEWDTWQTVTAAPTFSGNSYSCRFTIPNLDYTQVYTVQCRAADMVGITESNEYTINIVPLFDWGKDNFNFNIPVIIQGNQIADFIIETGTEAMGTNGTWYWSKWTSGRAECYGTRNFGKCAITDPWGVLYESASYSQDLPSGLFNDIPHVQLTVGDCGSSGAWLERGVYPPTKTSTGNFYFVRPTTATMSKSNVSFYCVGRWK